MNLRGIHANHAKLAIIAKKWLHLPGLVCLLGKITWMKAAETSYEESEVLLFNLWGTFSVTSSGGEDLTPKLAKCQALLALLARL